MKWIIQKRDPDILRAGRGKAAGWGKERRYPSLIGPDY
jgi:hypothetical protein